MLYEELQKRQKQLNELLFDMAKSMKSDDDITIITVKLKNIYDSGFRHVYSEFFSLIITISEEDNEYSLEYLSNNLEAIRVFVEENYISGNKQFKLLYKPVMKLCDHVNLEIGRYTHYFHTYKQLDDLKRRNSELREEFKNSTKELDRAKNELATARSEIYKVQVSLESTVKKLEETETKLKDSNKKVDNVQTELVAVLSIFAAIVFSFSGSLSILGNAFTNIAQPETGLKATFLVLLCGFVVSNTIFLMMYIVAKITGKSIYARCKTSDCSCEQKCSPRIRIKKRLPYVYWLNVSFFGLMILDVLIWYFDRLWNFIP